MQRGGDGARDARPVDSVTTAVVAVTSFALAARLFRLGDRVAHWDEARVGFDILRYVATGTWQYRPIVHGPFLPQVNYYLFGAVGASDFTARLVVALVGGLLPLTAVLFRRHLSGVETVAFAGVLAADPTLLYYSRFMRNDVPVAAFSLLAFGFVVRYVDTRRRRYVHGVALALALAFTTKANAVLYLLAIGGATLLVADHRLFLVRDRAASMAVTWGRSAGRELVSLWRTLTAGVVEFLLVIVFFYAPRNDEIMGIGLWRAFGEPGTVPAVVEAATVDAAAALVDTWVMGGHQGHPYLPYLEHYLTTLGLASAGVVVLAFLGFFADRYTGDCPRTLVALGAYWGIASVLGYPLVTDIKAPWAVVHAVVPLAFPAAAGVGRLHEWAREALAQDRRDAAVLVLIVGLLVGGQVAAVGVFTSYSAPQSPENPLVQYAQPDDDFHPTLQEIARLSRANEGVDIVWYGDHFYVAYENLTYRPPVPEATWYNRLPLPWYFEQYGATIRSVRRPSRLSQLVDAERPPVLIAQVSDRATVAESVEGYRVHAVFSLRQNDVDVVVFLRTGNRDGSRTSG